MKSRDLGSCENCPVIKECLKIEDRQMIAVEGMGKAALMDKSGKNGAEKDRAEAKQKLDYVRDLIDSAPQNCPGPKEHRSFGIMEEVRSCQSPVRKARGTYEIITTESNF